MQHHWLKKTDPATPLRVVMMGWASDHNMVCGSDFAEENILIIFDYTYPEMSEGLRQEIETYPKRYLTAWSFGVWVAEKIFSGRVTFDSATAINGTALPVDDRFGIPIKAFRLTVRGIERQGEQKFIERMCGDRIDHYRQHPSQRSLEDIAKELRILGQLFTEHQIEELIPWSLAIVASDDQIFPSSAQIEYWIGRGVRTLVKDNMPHYPF